MWIIELEGFASYENSGGLLKHCPSNPQTSLISNLHISTLRDPPSASLARSYCRFLRCPNGIWSSSIMTWPLTWPPAKLMICVRFVVSKSMIEYMLKDQSFVGPNMSSNFYPDPDSTPPSPRLKIPQKPSYSTQLGPCKGGFMEGWDYWWLLVVAGASTWLMCPSQTIKSFVLLFCFLMIPWQCHHMPPVHSSFHRMFFLARSTGLSTFFLFDELN